MLNGSGTHLDTSTESLKSDHSPSSTLQHSNNSEDELAKPKAREWEKHKAPWMAELKLSQMKKTSPSVEPRSPENVTDEKHDMSKSFSSSFVASKKASEFNSFEVRAHSVENKSASTFEVFKKEKEVRFNFNLKSRLIDCNNLSNRCSKNLFILSKLSNRAYNPIKHNKPLPT